MSYGAVITQSEIDRLLAYLIFFQDENNLFYSEVHGYMQESDEVGRFRKELDETGFLVVFDWIEWLRANEIYTNVDNDVDDHIRALDMDSLRKLMTCYIRGDRFNEGLFVRAIAKGKVTKILQRLDALKDSASI